MHDPFAALGENLADNIQQALVSIARGPNKD